MKSYETELKEIRSERKYNCSYHLNISKKTEYGIEDVANKLQLQREEAAELLMMLGQSIIDCWD